MLKAQDWSPRGKRACRALRLLSAPEELCWTHLRLCWQMTLPRKPSRVANPCRASPRPPSGSGGLTGREGRGVGASRREVPTLLLLFLFPDVLLCKESGPVSIADGNKSITAL